MLKGSLLNEDMSGVKSILSEMVDAEIPRSVSTFNVLLEHYCQVSSLSFFYFSLFPLFFFLSSFLLVKQTKTNQFLILISLHSTSTLPVFLLSSLKKKNITTVRALFHEMKNYQVEPDATTYTLFIDVLLHCQLIDEAIQVIERRERERERAERKKEKKQEREEKKREKKIKLTKFTKFRSLGRCKKSTNYV